MDEVVHRVYISEKDVHYGGGLVDGARILQLFGNATTELSVRLDGHEGLLAAYEEVTFHKPTRAGDFLEIRARLDEKGRRSRRMNVSAYRYIEGNPDDPERPRLLEEPVLVCEARLVAVVPRGHGSEALG